MATKTPDPEQLAPILELLDDMPCLDCGHHLMEHRREHDEKRPPYKCQVANCPCKNYQ